MKIAPLRNHMDLINEIAALHQAEWAHFDPDFTVETRTAALTQIAAHAGIPSIYVATEKSALCGTAALVEHDMDDHPELSPWLSAVFVKEAWRGRGIAKALVRHCEQKAHHAGAEKLYLFTEFAAKLYATLGWKTLERCYYKGTEVEVMFKELGAIDQASATR